MRARVNTLTLSSSGAAYDNSPIPSRGRLVELECPSDVNARVPDGSVLKPTGSGRKGYNLMDKMGLSRHHKEFYNRIRVWLVSSLTYASY